MRLHVHLTDEHGARETISGNLADLAAAGDLLKEIAQSRDPYSFYRPGSASRITRVAVTWEA